MFSCCQHNFSSNSEYILHRHNMHCEWADKPYSCEGHPLNEAGKPIGNRNVLFSSEFRVFKHESSCSHNKAYLCRVVGDMTSVEVRRPPSKGSDTGLDEWNSKEYFLKRLQSEEGWLTEADFNAIARDQNSRNPDAYIFSPDMYSQICCILFPGGGSFRLRRWDNFDKCLEKMGFDEKVFEKERIFSPLGINLDTGAHKDPNHWVLVEVNLRNPAITIFDSLRHKFTWPTNPLIKQLGTLLNTLQDHTGWEIVDWTTIDPTFPPAPRQQKGDSVNCAIIVTLIMELRLVNEEVTWNKFPISKMELFHVRKRLIYNLDRFNTARILYHIENNKK